MTGRGTALALAVAIGAAFPASAHQFNVFAWSDCEAITVEATLENGRPPVSGEVRLRNGSDAVIMTLDLGKTGSRRIPLDGLDTGSGVKVEVESGDHSDYWMLTPEDIVRKCRS